MGSSQVSIGGVGAEGAIGRLPSTGLAGKVTWITHRIVTQNCTSSDILVIAIETDAHIAA
jgi:hypothetical protein